MHEFNCGRAETIHRDLCIVQVGLARRKHPGTLGLLSLRGVPEPVVSDLVKASRQDVLKEARGRSGHASQSRLIPAPVLRNGPEAEVSEELCEGSGLVVGVEAAGVGKDPGVAAAEGGLLEADAGVFDAGDDAVGTDADEGDDGWPPAFDFGFEALPAGAKFVVGEFIGASGGALDDVGDAEFEFEKEGSFKR